MRKIFGSAEHHRVTSEEVARSQAASAVVCWLLPWRAIAQRSGNIDREAIDYKQAANAAEVSDDYALFLLVDYDHHIWRSVSIT